MGPTSYGCYITGHKNYLDGNVGIGVTGPTAKLDVAGDLNVTGAIYAGTKDFVIDHPLDPANKLLTHSCVESPENLVIYRGKATLDANGEGLVELPSYFKALTREDGATISLTPVGRPFQVGSEWQAGFISFKAYGNPNREVYWAVYADRDDPVSRRLARPVEEDKGPESKICGRGELLYPEAYGYPESMGRNFDKTHAPMQDN